MNAIIQQTLSFFSAIQKLGPVLFVPIIILITGMCFGLNWTKAFRAAITVGVGFIGVNLVLSIVWDNLGPVTQIIVERFGLKLDVLDTSWSAAAAISFTTRIGVVIIPFVLLVNLIMLFFRMTKTVNIDIWNYWHFAISGSLITEATGSLLIGFTATACHVAIVLKFADISAEAVKKELNIPGISIPHANSAALVPLYMLLDKIYDRIPLLSCKFSDKDIVKNKYLSFLSEPVVMGFIIGTMLGAIAGVSVLSCATVAMNMAALMLLLPRAVKIIMEGLIPISQATKKFMDKKFNGREIFIGLDSAVTLGHPTTLAASMVLIPITLCIAFVLPGNSTIPVGDLVAIGFFIALATPIHKGNLVRTIISGTITTSLMMLICSYFAPHYTKLAMDTGGMNLPQKTALISSLAIGDPTAWMLSTFANIRLVGVLIMLVFTAAIIVLCKLYETKRAVKKILP